MRVCSLQKIGGDEKKGREKCSLQKIGRDEKKKKQKKCKE